MDPWPWEEGSILCLTDWESWLSEKVAWRKEKYRAIQNPQESSLLSVDQAFTEMRFCFAFSANSSEQPRVSDEPFHDASFSYVLNAVLRITG